MPRKPIDYSRTVIYKIEHNEKKELVYVGSTIEFTKRKYGHKTSCNNINDNKHNHKVYQMIRDNGGWEAFQMLEIKKFPCLDGNECRAEEERCRIELKANMNSIKAFHNSQEYHKQWYLENYEKKKQYRLETAENRIEYDKQYRLENAERLKQYRLENAEKIRERCKKWYENKKKNCD